MSTTIVSTETWMLLRLGMFVVVLAGFAVALGVARLARR
jgi:hypothetical protein